MSSDCRIPSRQSYTPFALPCASRSAASVQLRGNCDHKTRHDLACVRETKARPRLNGSMACGLNTSYSPLVSVFPAPARARAPLKEQRAGHPGKTDRFAIAWRRGPCCRHAGANYPSTERNERRRHSAFRVQGRARLFPSRVTGDPHDFGILGRSGSRLGGRHAAAHQASGLRAAGTPAAASHRSPPPRRARRCGRSQAEETETLKRDAG